MAFLKRAMAAPWRIASAILQQSGCRCASPFRNRRLIEQALAATQAHNSPRSAPMCW